MKRDTIAPRMKEIRENCMSFLSEIFRTGDRLQSGSLPKDKLPACFYHIIDAIYDFPYASELATVTADLSRKLDFRECPS